MMRPGDRQNYNAKALKLFRQGRQQECIQVAQEQSLRIFTQSQDRMRPLLKMVADPARTFANVLRLVLQKPPPADSPLCPHHHSLTSNGRLMRNMEVWSGATTILI